MWGDVKTRTTISLDELPHHVTIPGKKYETANDFHEWIIARGYGPRVSSNWGNVFGDAAAGVYRTTTTADWHYAFRYLHDAIAFKLRFG